MKYIGSLAIALVLFCAASSVPADESTLEPIPLPQPPGDTTTASSATVTQSPVVADTAPQLGPSVVTPAPVVTEVPVPIAAPAPATAVTTTTYTTTYSIPTPVVYAPAVTVYRPATATIVAPVVTLRPVTTITTVPPVAPAAVYHVAPSALFPIGPPVFVRPRLHIPGQPVRNFIRATAP